MPSDRIRIDPTARAHALRQQQRHQKFLDALQIVEDYCREEGSRYATEGARPGSSAALHPPRGTRQKSYEVEMRALYEKSGPFTKAMLFDHLADIAAFADISPEAVESAIKRGVNVSRVLERVEVDGKKGYVRPTSSGRTEPRPAGPRRRRARQTRNKAA